MNQNRKRFIKRVAGLTVATTLVVGAPVAPSVLSSLDTYGIAGSSVVHAASQNLLEHGNSHIHVGHHWDNSVTRHVLSDGANPTIELNLEKNYIYTIKFPDELAYLLNDDQVTNKLIDEFVFGGYVIDSDGDPVTSHPGVDKAAQYVSINHSTNSLEFNLTDLHTDNDLTFPEPRRSHYTFKTTLTTNYKALDNGEYIFKTALTEGSADLDNVPSANTETIVVDYNDGDQTPEEPEQPEEPGDGDQNPEEPEQPEEPGEPGDGDQNPEEPEQAEEPGETGH